jgi:hypothetical protein
MFKLSDIQDAFLFVSGAPRGMHTAILCKHTGQIRYRSEGADLNEIGEEELDWNACIEIPHRNDLDLGQGLVFEFVESVLPGDYEHVRQIFRKVLRAEPQAVIRDLYSADEVILLARDIRLKKG